MKHTYGSASHNRLITCSPAVQKVMQMAAEYLNISILCGHRDKAEQEEAVKKGFSQVHFPNSDHNRFPSDAVDAGIFRPDIANVDYNDRPAFGFLAGVLHVCAEQQGCVAVWGHDWDHDFNFNEHEFKDLPHFLILTKEDYEKRKKK